MKWDSGLSGTLSLNDEFLHLPILVHGAACDRAQSLRAESGHSPQMQTHLAQMREADFDMTFAS